MPTLREKLMVIINTHRTRLNWVRDHFDKCGALAATHHVDARSQATRYRCSAWLSPLPYELEGALCGGYRVGCRYCEEEILRTNRGKSQEPGTNCCPPKTTIAATAAASKQAAMPLRWSRWSRGQANCWALRLFIKLS